MDERSIALEKSFPARSQELIKNNNNEVNEPVNSFRDIQEKERQRVTQQNRRIPQSTLTKPLLFVSIIARCRSYFPYFTPSGHQESIARQLKFMW
ncbi:hypothetical protein KIN20_011820 [Parelaphostrongylus tenuis]|uniref:Uncharacterized protein n=1 Tax=Parelaphostrongylus tenuis TaxID=148309 RepID=A0AAD5MEK6_PARTN|nr:hypothetical protein KIN20_011820 [Parelaphostrongylus tenuis]